MSTTTHPDVQLMGMRRDRAAGAAHAASLMLFDVLFHELTPEGRAKARAYVHQLQGEAAVLREEHRIAQRRHAPETRLLAERLA